MRDRTASARLAVSVRGLPRRPSIEEQTRGRSTQGPSPTSKAMRLDRRGIAEIEGRSVAPPDDRHRPARVSTRARRVPGRNAVDPLARRTRRAAAARGSARATTWRTPRPRRSRSPSGESVPPLRAARGPGRRRAARSRSRRSRGGGSGRSPGAWPRCRRRPQGKVRDGPGLAGEPAGGAATAACRARSAAARSTDSTSSSPSAAEDDEPAAARERRSREHRERQDRDEGEAPQRADPAKEDDVLVQPSGRARSRGRGRCTMATSEAASATTR